VQFLQNKGSYLDPDFRLSDADDVIRWSLKRVSVTKADLVSTKDVLVMQSMYRFDRKPFEFGPAALKNKPLANAAGRFPTLFLYQLFEALV
jgi:hypothetical protein